MSRAKAALAGSLSAQVFMVVTMILSIVTTPFFLKMLSVEEYGASIILYQIVLYLSIFDFGLGAAITRELARYRNITEENEIHINKIITTSFFILLLLGLLIIVSGFIVAYNFDRLFSINYSLRHTIIAIVITLSISLGIQFPLKAFNSIFYAHQKQFLFNLMSFYSSIINTVGIVIFLLFKVGLWAFVYANIVSTLFTLLITYFFIRKYYKFLKIRFIFYDKHLIRQLFNYGFFIFLNSIAVQIVFYTDRVVIGSIISLASVAAFSLTSRIPELSMQLIFKVTQSSFPALVEVSNNEIIEKTSSIYKRLMVLTISLIMVAFWLILCFNEIFISLWVGKNYYAGEIILLLSLLIMVTQCSVYVHATCLNSAGKVKGLSLVSMIEAGINIFISIWLCRKIGMYGVLIGTVTASLISSSWYSPYYNMKYLQLSFYEFFFKPVIIPSIFISILGLIMYSLIKYIQKVYAFNWITFLISMTLAGMIMLLFVWSFILKEPFKEYIPVKYKKILFS